MKSLSVLVHVYYPGSWSLIQERCNHVFQDAENLIVSTCHDDVVNEIEVSDSKAVILKVPNQGKDIGGKFCSLSYYLSCCTKTEYLVFLHDKVSPQSLNAGYWFDKLYGIFKEKKFLKILSLFKRKKKIGIAGARAFLKNEYNRRNGLFNTTNSEILHSLIKRFGLQCREYNYVGGTIFIARSKLFDQFFSEHSPLELREGLEKGNVLDLNHGTNTHSWERMFCFIAQAQGYKVIGV